LPSPGNTAKKFAHSSFNFYEDSNNLSCPLLLPRGATDGFGYLGELSFLLLLLKLLKSLHFLLQLLDFAEQHLGSSFIFFDSQLGIFGILGNFLAFVEQVSAFKS
jgi:hypothetical protein